MTDNVTPILTPVSQLSGNALEWAMASILWPFDTYVKNPEQIEVAPYRFSTQWGEAGPLFEREPIESFSMGKAFDGTFSAALKLKDQDAEIVMAGAPTLLIAAVRCFVASKLGLEIELPAFLTPAQQQ